MGNVDVDERMILKKFLRKKLWRSVLD